MDHHLDNWNNDEEAVIPNDLPQVFLWRMLVMPVKPRKVSAGGIVIAESARDAEQYLTYIGKVLDMGPLCYKGERFAGQPPESLPKVGDWVGYGKYAGQPIMFKGLRLIVLNDDNVLFRAESPEGFRIHI